MRYFIFHIFLSQYKGVSLDIQMDNKRELFVILKVASTYFNVIVLGNFIRYGW